ncbi:MAG: orotidine-5'-phosphate decarboxylase [Kangiellaceae bacterium]|nr:orotidine-5'-phosphate decarboxylase [Kangiellaceae bacterium]
MSDLSPENNDGKRIIVALDYDNVNDAKRLVSRLDPNLCRLKVGKEMFTLYGPDWVRYLINQDFDVFLDLKFHDIPNTVAKACTVAATLGVWMVNLHAAGGVEMMMSAQRAIAQFGDTRPLLTAVTILTSIDQQQYEQLGYTRTIDQQVLHFAKLAQMCKLDGVVCSANEAASLSKALGSRFQLVTPGIRPEGCSKDDQSRTMTPKQAIAAGSSHLVIGRPITQSADPLKSLCEISESFAFN